MTKTIETLVDDMNSVIMGEKGWSDKLAEHLGSKVGDVVKSRLGSPQEPRGYLSMSALGQPCKRKLWYKVNKTDKGEAIRANTFLKFLYGDIIEELVLAIVKQSGHHVSGEQDRMAINGISGSRDCVIDGMTVDVKSASPIAFKKFKEGNLREDDPFGYISQLSSYVYAAKNDPLVTNKKEGAFLVVDKVNGNICLDKYDFTCDMLGKEAEVSEIKDMASKKTPPPRGFEDVPQSKTSPNRKLSMQCSYCEFKKMCYPEVRKFIYSNGPTYLTKVVKELKVPEDTDW